MMSAFRKALGRSDSDFPGGRSKRGRHDLRQQSLQEVEIWGDGRSHYESDAGYILGSCSVFCLSYLGTPSPLRRVESAVSSGFLALVEAAGFDKY